MEGVCLCHAQYSSTSLACNLVIFTPFKSVGWSKQLQRSGNTWEYFSIASLILLVFLPCVAMCLWRLHWSTESPNALPSNTGR